MKLKNKTIIPVVIGVCVIAIVMLFSANYYIKQNFNNQLSVRIDSKQTDLNQLLDDISNRATIMAAIVSEINYVVEAYNKHNITNDIEQSIQIMIDNGFNNVINSLKKQGGIKDVRIHFHLPPAKSLWRIWTDKRGDDLSSFRNTILKTNREKVVTRGIEAGVGGAVIRGIVPIIDKKTNRHLGSVEAFFRMNDFIDNAVTTTDENVAVYIESKVTNLYEQTLQQNKDLIGNFIIENQSTNFNNSIIKLDKLNSGMKKLTTDIIGTFANSYFPLKDYSGNNIGVIIYQVDISNNLQAISTMQQTMIYFTIPLLIIIVFIIYKLLKNTVSNINIVKDTFLKVEEGDFTQRIKIETNDEINDLAESLNLFIAKQGVLIYKLKENSKRIKSSSEVFSNQIQEIADASKDVSNSIDNTSSAITEFSTTVDSISNNINSQSSAVEETTSQSNQMLKSLENVSANVSNVNDSISQTSSAIEQVMSNISNITDNTNALNDIALDSRNAADEGAKEINNVVDKMKNIFISLQTLVDAMKNLGTNAENIGRIIETINDISDQTNLLALNAAIEAARAGDAGKGFAVVADEVRKLAERSINSTKEINGIITNIRNSIDDVVKVTNQSAGLSEQGQTVAETTKKSFRVIIDKIDSMVQRINHVNTSMKETNSGGEQIVKEVEKITNFMNDVTVSSKEQTNGLREITLAMDNINKMSEEIKLAMSEQIKGISQIEKSIENISYASKSNTTSTEKSSAEIISLINISDSLFEEVNKYKISEKTISDQKGIILKNDDNLFAWDDKYSVNVKKMDDQHKKLFNLINELYSHMKKGHGKDHIANTLQELLNYTDYHFGNEEKILENNNYPEIEEQKRLHKMFVDKMLDAQKDFLAGRGGVSVQLTFFLKDWLIGHIGKIDKKYEDFMNKKGIY